jgi:hypothetical protein
LAAVRQCHEQLGYSGSNRQGLEQPTALSALVISRRLLLLGWRDGPVEVRMPKPSSARLRRLVRIH